MSRHTFPELVAFDLDGTLIEDHLVDTPDGGMKPREDGVHYTEPRLLPQTVERLFELRHADRTTRFAICTNQGGVAMGFQTVGEVHERIGRTLEMLDFFWGASFSIHYSPHHEMATEADWKGTDHQLERRKPRPGMLLDAMAAAAATPAGTLYVGDRGSDRETAINAKCWYLDTADMQQPEPPAWQVAPEWFGEDL